MLWCVSSFFSLCRRNKNGTARYYSAGVREKRFYIFSGSIQERFVTVSFPPCAKKPQCV